MNRRLAVLRSVTIVSVSTYIEFAIGFVVSVWIARALGPADFGRYAFTVWLCGWLIVCSNHALTTSSTKFIAEADGTGHPDVAAHIAARLSRFQHVSSLLVVALFVIGTLIIQPREWQGLLIPVTGAIAIAVFAKASYGMLVAIAKGQERFEPEAIATVATGVISVGLVIAATLARAGLMAFIAIFAISCLSVNLINRIACRKYCRPFSPGPIPDDIRIRLYRHLRLTAVLVLLGSLSGTTIAMFLLNTFSTTTAVGFFAIALMLTRGAVQLFSVGLTSTLLPYMAKSFGQHGQDRATLFLSEASRFYWAMGLAIAGLGLVATPGIVTLMYGTRYLDAIPVIEAILVLSGLLLVGNGIAAFQTVVDRQDDRIRVTAGSLVAHAILGILLIPGMGLTGAVLCLFGGRMAELVLSIYYLRHATSGGIPVAAMTRLFAVGILTTAAAWLSTAWLPVHYGFVLGAIVFIALYVPASILVNYWTDEDYRLMGLITARLGSPGRMLMRTLNSLRRGRFLP